MYFAVDFRGNAQCIDFPSKLFCGRRWTNKDHATDQLQFVFNFFLLQLTMSRLIVLGMILTKRKLKVWDYVMHVIVVCIHKSCSVAFALLIYYLFLWASDAHKCAIR